MLAKARAPRAAGAFALAGEGMAGRALAAVHPNALARFAGAAALTGARDSALAWLRETRGYPNLITPARRLLDPTLASLRGDPRSEALLATPPR